MTILAVVATYILIFVGALIMGFFVGQPPWPGEIILPGAVLIGAVAINIAVRWTRASAARTAAWTAGPIAAYYGVILTAGWMRSGSMALGSLFTSVALVAGLLLGLLLLHKSRAENGVA